MVRRKEFFAREAGALECRLKEKEKMNMKHDYDDLDEWLKDRIDEDLMAMADEREKLLMESEELQDIDMPAERLQDIHREVETRKQADKRVNIRRRMMIAVAAVAVLCVGMGVVGTGSKLYRPEITEQELGADTTTKINNNNAEDREYDEEKVCQEVEEKLGVLSIRFGYQPVGMRLIRYNIEEKTSEAILEYGVEERKIYIYISKDYSNSSINYQTDGEKRDTLIIDSNKLEIEVFKYQDSTEKPYYISSFEYLNTYYSIHGIMEHDEFIKILENILIKNV